ncbi:MAG: DUF2520 domain-containing protein [Bacteroidaceae bacterium]|nr:DUF2520 domain-containing protein [Bacteroidaceae bacterium]
MKIAIIGAGRVATNLAPALKQSGAEVVEVWSKSRTAAETLAGRLSCRCTWGALDDVTRQADIYLIAVTDAALPSVVGQLHEGREQALMVHTAGSMPLSLFADAAHERGGVFYPMQTFSKERAVDFARVHFFIEASRQDDAALLYSLALNLTADERFVHKSTAASRRRLHLAAVFACNFLNHCCTLSEEILGPEGLDFSVMLPLVDETVAKLHELSPRDAQTGPAVRRDDNVIGMQRAMLADRPDLQKIYSMLTKSIQQYD